MTTIRCWNSADELAAAVAAEMARAVGQPHPVPHAIMLAGGATPLAAYQLLTAHPPHIAPSTHIFFSDDRHVPPSDPRSNFGQIQPMLKAWQLPDSRVMRVEGEQTLPEATQNYDQVLARYLDGGGLIPLGLLGLGTDGHTASLFTPEHIRQGSDTWAISVARPDGLSGISVTPRLLNRVQRLLFVVSRSAKKDIVQKLLTDPTTLPAGLATAQHPDVELWMDQAASP